MEQNPPEEDDILSADQETTYPYRTRSFVIALETERHLTVFWTIWIQPTLSQHIYFVQF